MMSEPWYKQGLNFSCTQCGKCCTGSPGYVWLSDQEMKEIAMFLGISLEKFVQNYTRQVGHRYSLLETGPSFDCIFLEEKKCQIYGARPKQCRTYPFWDEPLASKEAWDEEAKRCEGISKEAELISMEEIRRRRNG